MSQLDLFPEMVRPRENQEIKPGAWVLPNFMTEDEQVTLMEQVRQWTDKGWHAPAMPDGKLKLGHKIACLGWNWKPYEYYPSDRPFPIQLHFWAKRAVKAAYGEGAYKDFNPDVAIVNYYQPGESLSLHCDRSEDQQLQDAGSPIVTIGLGDSGVCRQGNCRDKNGPYHDFTMESGDIWVMGGAARKSYHAMLKVVPRTSPITMKAPGRVSITIRQARYIAPPDPNAIKTIPATPDNLQLGDRVVSRTGEFPGHVGWVADIQTRPNIGPVFFVQYQPDGVTYPRLAEYLSKVVDFDGLG